MPTGTFIWKPDLGAQREITPSVERIKFGDGYEQRVSQGLNLMPKIWSVSFGRASLEAKAILDFLQERAGLQSFTWTDPMNETGTYVCRQWEHSQEKLGMYKVTCKFEEVFEY